MGPPPRGDADGDGVCDDTEVSRGLDPRRPDTDGDGWPDGVELALSFDARTPMSPPRDRVDALSESAGATVTRPIYVTVRGEGETYSGAFGASYALDAFGEDAASHYVSARAVGAMPPENVAVIEEAAQTFRGVRGRTTLIFEVTFGMNEVIPRACVRAFAWRYLVKRDTGGTVAVPRYVLVVAPPGSTTFTGPWCAPPPGCF
jgi:hypothetical protein